MEECLGVTRELLMTPILAMTALFHVLMLKSGKAVEQDEVGEVQGNNFPGPFWGTDKDKIVPYIQTLHKINKELWPQAGITRTSPLCQKLPPQVLTTEPSKPWELHIPTRSSPGSE